jgi:adenylate kinase
MPPILPKVDGVCDRCGAKDSLVQRDDDKESVVRSRMVSYSEQTAPLLHYYDNMGILQHFKVNGGVKDLLPGFVDRLRNL